MSENDIVEAQGWKSVVKEKHKNKFWYQNSSTGAYVKRGCKAKYKIHYNKLSHSKADNVRSYRGNKRNTTRYWQKFSKCCNVAGLSTGVVVAGVSAAICLAPFSEVATLIIGLALGMGLSISYENAKGILLNLRNTHKSYNKMKSKYKIIRKYGNKY